MKPKVIYNVVDATKMSGRTRGKRNMDAMKEAIRMAKEHPEVETTLFKLDKSKED